MPLTYSSTDLVPLRTETLDSGKFQTLSGIYRLPTPIPWPHQGEPIGTVSEDFLVEKIDVQITIVEKTSQPSVLVIPYDANNIPDIDALIDFGNVLTYEEVLKGLGFTSRLAIN